MPGHAGACACVLPRHGVHGPYSGQWLVHEVQVFSFAAFLRQLISCVGDILMAGVLYHTFVNF